MDKTHFQTLFAYHWHTIKRLLEVAKQLDDATYHAHPGYGHGSIHDILFHLLRADQGWLAGIKAGKQLPPINVEDYPDLPALSAGFATVQADWEQFLSELSEEEIAGNIELHNWRGEKMTFAYWRLLQHLLFHGLQHQSEVAQLLTIHGQSPGDLDFIFFNE